MNRRRHSRGLGIFVGVFLLAAGLVVPEQNDVAQAFSLADDGGHEGTSGEEGFLSSGEGGSGAEAPARFVGGENAPVVCRSDKPLEVLFIGNSYTHYFDMPEMLEGMAQSAGCAIHAEMVAPGGSSLKFHADYGPTLSAISSRSWDIVVLQNFSLLPSLPEEEVKEKTFPSVQKLVDAIRLNDPRTELYFYVTWGRRDGDKKNCARHEMVCTFEGHTEALYRGYSLYAEEFGGRLANVGGAFAKIASDERAPFTYRELYHADGSHPGLKGSYLAASVFFGTFYKTSPLGLSYPQELTEDFARYLQRVAASLPVSGA